MNTIQLKYNAILNYIRKGNPLLAKLLLFISTISLIIVSFFFYNFPRSIYQISTAYLSAIAMELLLFYTTSRYKNDTLTNRCLSACTEVGGLILLVRSLSPNYYAISAALAVASKYFFTKPNGQHLFNPSNFAIIMTIAFFPISSTYIRPDPFNYNIYPILHVLSFGLVITSLAKVTVIPISYLLTYIIIALFYQGPAYLGGFFDIIGPELGATGLIFIWLMITDPATSPKSTVGRIFFAASVAVLGFAGRLHNVVYANFIALFTTYLLYNIKLVAFGYAVNKSTK